MYDCKFHLIFITSLVLYLSANAFDENNDQIDFITEFYKTYLKNEGKCILENCARTFEACLLDKKCREAAICNIKCQSKLNVDG